MKRILSFFALLVGLALAFSQTYWSQANAVSGKKDLKNPHYYRLDINQLSQKLSSAQSYLFKLAKPIEIVLPSVSGKMEKFMVYSFPVMDEALARQYNLGSFIGINSENPEITVRFSIAPNDFQSMVMKEGKYEFIEPQSTDKKVYAVFEKSNKKPFECKTGEKNVAKTQMKSLVQDARKYKNFVSSRTLSSDRKYRTLRLALSVTGEYTAYFGGTVAGALTAMNATMTRVNGVMEKDLALHLNMINNTTIIYTNAATDPYSDAATGADGAWNTELMNTLHNPAICGDAAYDIGHLFGASGGGGNAGCIGCICNNSMVPDIYGDINYKGSGFTSPADGIPSGDNFDIDYVAHEMGHQLGGNHTFAFDVEGTGVNVEPGSGSTIMGYAGITNADVQAHSDAYYHTVSIDQIQTTLVGTTCDVETAVANTPPSIAALPSYTIPKSTAFVLTASATDAEANPMTYTWEEVDDAAITPVDATTGNNSRGPLFRSWSPTTNPTRYFPKLSSVLAGNLTVPADWETVSNVPRSTNYKITVRDNHPTVTQQQTSSKTQSITVGSDGPFKVLNRDKFYNNTNTPINWNVANTAASPYNVANVKIDYTTNSGATWTVLSASTPNDGTESFNLTGIAGPIIVRVSAIGNVFYAVSNNLVSTPASACSLSAPTNFSISAVSYSSASLSWDLLLGATYIVRYKKTTDSTWTQLTTSANSLTLTGLAELTNYDVQVATVCSGTTGTFTATSNFKTLERLFDFCDSSSYDSLSEYIANVTVGTMSNTSTYDESDSYSDYTSIAAAQVNLTQGNSYTISVKKAWYSTKYKEAVSAWIDWNRDGIFDTTERIMNSALSTTTPVSTTFTVPMTSMVGVPLRLRVIMSDATISSACGFYDYGETEDYKVIVTAKLATNENAAAKSIAMYPNPVKDEFKVGNVSSTASYKIYSMDGKLIKEGKLKDNAGNASDLVKGVYLITVTDNDQTYNTKFIKD